MCAFSAVPSGRRSKSLDCRVAVRLGPMCTFGPAMSQLGANVCVRASNASVRGQRVMSGQRLNSGPIRNVGANVPPRGQCRGDNFGPGISHRRKLRSPAGNEKTGISRTTGDNTNQKPWCTCSESSCLPRPSKLRGHRIVFVFSPPPPPPLPNISQSGL